jgi:hypothetical protein
MAGRHHYPPKDPQQDPDHIIIGSSGLIAVIVVLYALEIIKMRKMTMRRMMILLTLVPSPISNPPKWMPPLV